MMKYLKITISVFSIVILYSCTQEEALVLPEQDKQAEILELIQFDEITENSISYSVKGENLEKLAQFGGQSLTVGEKKLLVSPDLEKSLVNGRLANDALAKKGGLQLLIQFPKYGDIYLVAEAIVQSGGTCHEPSRTCSGGTIVEVQSSFMFGAPDEFHQVSVRVDGSNNNWLIPYSSISKYVGSSVNYQPGAYELLGFKYQSKKLYCSDGNPMARASATWLINSAVPYTIVKCDD